MTYKSKRIWAPVLGALLVSGALTGAQETPVEKQPKRIRVSQGVVEANLLKKVAPTYPEAAKAARVEGLVVLTVIITEGGKIQEVRLRSGDPLLAPAAMEAVKQWAYKPYLLNGEPIEVETTITVRFQLRNQPPLAPQALPPEVAGTFTGTVYRNDFFGFQCALPAELAVKTNELKGGLGGRTVLLHASAEQTQFRPGKSVTLMAEDARYYWGEKWSEKTGADYVAKVTQALKERGILSSGLPTEFRLGKLAFHRQNYTTESPLRPVQSVLAAVHEGYVITVILIGPGEHDLDSLFNLFTEVKVTSKSPSKAKD
ncbi:MAG TPA: energy transducer TonB [Terriglobales bacterium]|nr:energy transducer TonB [Terriglobales bacterium]